MIEPHNTMSSESLNIGDFYYLVFRHKWKIIIFTLLGLIGAAVVFFLTPAVYESEATLLVRYISEKAVTDPTATGERITSPGRGGENIMNSEIAILSSRDLVEKVMDEMGIIRFSSEFSGDGSNVVDRARVAGMIMAALRIEVLKNSNVIRVTFDGTNPTVAQEFLRRLTESYLLKHIEIHRAAGAYEFFSQQTDQLRARLAETEEDLRKLKYSEGIVSIDDTKKSIAMRSEDLKKGLGDLETALAAAKAREEVIKSLISSSVVNQVTNIWPTGEGGAEPSSLKVRLVRLQQKESELLSAYTPDSIPVKNVRDQILETQRLLENEKPLATVTNVVSSDNTTNYLPVLIEGRASIAELQAKITMQKELLNRVMAEAKRIDSVEMRIVEMQRNRDLQESNYKYFCQSLEHARIDEALNSGRISNISIVQPATLPTKKIYIKLPQKIGIVLFLGIACGLGLAIVQEHFFDRTIRRPVDLQNLFNVPVLMSFPKLKPSQLNLKASSAQPRLFLNAHEETAAGNPSTAAEEPFGLNDLYDALKDRLETLTGPETSERPYLLGVTGCIKGSGVSTIATGLALALARSGAESVVLIDANTASGAPTLFGVNPLTGLMEITADYEGHTAETTASYLNTTQRLIALFQHLRTSKASFVIVDMPPVTETSLTLRISRFLNGVLLVIASEKVNRNVAESAKGWLDQAEAKIIGSVLNKRRRYVPDWLYPNY